MEEELLGSVVGNVEWLLGVEPANLCLHIFVATLSLAGPRLIRTISSASTFRTASIIMAAVITRNLCLHL